MQFYLFRGLDMKMFLRANKNIIEKKHLKIEVKNSEAFLLAVNIQFTVPC